MAKRAEQVAQTRLRITEAAVQLHTTVGPAHTTISALADAADVTRLTVYRHFADEEELFAECRAHWIRNHPPPDPAEWAQFPQLEPRARHALAQLYGWYHLHREALFPIYRDFPTMPSGAQDTMRATDTALADALLAGSDAGGRVHRLQRAAAGHVIAYPTWHSLAIDHGLGNPDAVDLAVRLLTSADPAKDTGRLS